MSEDKKPSIFKKVLEAGEAALDAQIFKAKSQLTMNKNVGEDEDFFFGKAVTEDPSYQVHSQGFKEKPHRLQNGHLKQMSYSNSVVAAVIQTRQNQVSNHSKLVKSTQERGFMIKLKDEDEILEKIKEELRKDGDSKKDKKDDKVKKADPSEEAPQDAQGLEADTSSTNDNKGKSDDEAEEFDRELHRKAKEELEKRYAKARRAAERYIQNCGDVDDKPFEFKKWNFEAALRAWTRDTLTYDLYATELVPNKLDKVLYWFPVDGSTVRFSSNSLSKYKDLDKINFTSQDLLYPERPEIQKKRMEPIKLKEDLLERDAYKWVQVVRGKIERAYTNDELKVGIRNVNTDIYNNGYGIAELELLVKLVTGHLNAEYYNQSFFTQGFSAKGILHIKKALNRRKLETVRQQWQHMIRGARNSFQTPIFAGVDEVNWIPFTQKHEDIGFEGWMRYLIKMICSIYQIDPMEIGVPFKDEGGSGMSGDNTKEKRDASRDKGLAPLLNHLQTYITEQILAPFDDRFQLVFTGVDDEDQKEALERQEKEVKFKKTVNEIRAEDGLPPLPGMDDVILETNYMQWYNQYSPRAIAKQKADMEAQQAQMGAEGGDPGMEGEMGGHDEAEAFYDDMIDSRSMDQDMPPEEVQKSLRKSKRPRKIKVEYYKLGKE